MFLKLCVGGLAFVLVHIVASAFHHLFFHPLRKFPGPPLARVSRLWSRIGNLKGRKSERIHEAHRKYGTIVRIGPNELSFAEPGAVREIYNSDVFVKEESFYRAKRIFHEDFLLSYRDPEAHKQRRKLLSRGFSQAAMLDFEPHIDTKITAMLDHWAEKAVPSQAIDVYSWVHWLGFDIVCKYHLMFDEDPGSVTNGRPHQVMPYFRAWKPTYIYTCAGLPFLQAVINETLRRYPTIIATLPRTATQDTTVRDTVIPKGTIVGVQNYTIHRDEQAFPNCEEWNPDRWLTKEGEELRKQAWVPFSMGSRKCIGINLAQIELSKITAAFFRRFEATIDPSMHEEDMRMFDTFNASPAGARLVLRLRELAS
ncbi:hypothetical protein ACJ41O_006252 [Fusarium nematophilum]